MKTVGIFTTTRAEFGLLSALLRQIERDRGIDYKLFVGGTHLAAEHDKTIREIQQSGFAIHNVFDYLLNDDNSAALAKSTGIATIELSRIFEYESFDFVCILGDRFELLAIVTNAILFKKPIIHIHGGERTEGIIDEQIRHMITKAAHIHFATCEEYAENIRRMGESAWRVHNVGALSVDNIVQMKKISKSKLFDSLNLSDGKPVILMTYHPVTLEFEISPLQQIMNIFSALNAFDLQVVITASNIEVDRDQIVQFLQHKASKNPVYRYVESLGVVKYLSLMQHCSFVIGNSSSGINETPYFRIPTINIGDRQQGRIRHRSVIDTDYSSESIAEGIKKALTRNFVTSLQNIDYKFGNGSAAQKIVEIIKNLETDSGFFRKKLDFPLEKNL